MPSRAIMHVDLDNADFTPQLKMILSEWGRHPLTVAAAREIVRYAETNILLIALDLGYKQTEVLTKPAKHIVREPSQAIAVVVGNEHRNRPAPPRISLFLRRDTDDPSEKSATLKRHAENSHVFYAEMVLPALATFSAFSREFVTQTPPASTRGMFRLEVMRFSAKTHPARQLDAPDARPVKLARARH
jgi:hypothetical protein